MAKESAAKPKVKATGIVKKDESKNGLAYLVPYFLFTVVIVAYSGFLYDTEGFRSHAKNFVILQPFEVLFDTVEKYSPFHQFLEDSAGRPSPNKPKEEVKTEEKKIENEKELLITAEELRKYDGSEGSPGIYLALLGQVFDVTSGKDYYGPGGGYSFFSGKDASRAFVSGEFNDAGLTDDVEGLSYQDYIGLDEWSKFYRKDYKYVGKVVGRFYDAKGEVTEEWKKLQGWIRAAFDDADKKSEEKKIFPPCNSEWSGAKGQIVWCTTKSGGIDRGWVGVPRRLFTPGRQEERCVCVKDFGESLYQPGSEVHDRGDLDNPNLKEYDNCDPKAVKCQIKLPENQ